METTKEVSIEIRKHNLGILWFISDRWFRILEFSLILATLYYFKDKTGNILVGGIYWLSWMIFYMWFLELGELISAKLSSTKKFSKNGKFLVWVLSMFPVLMIYMIITGVANSIMSAR